MMQESEAGGPRVALVTGGSRGIGAAIARRLSKDGYEVIINYASNEQAAAQTKADIEAQGGRAYLRQFDVTLAEETADAIEGLLRAHKTSVVVNNAGVVADGPFPVMEQRDWQRVIETTLSGFYNVTRPLLMPMIRARFGRVINLSSVSGLMGN